MPMSAMYSIVSDKGIGGLQKLQTYLSHRPKRRLQSKFQNITQYSLPAGPALASLSQPLFVINEARCVKRDFEELATTGKSFR